MSIMNGKSNPLPDNIMELLTQSQSPGKKKKRKSIGSYFISRSGRQHAPIVPSSASHSGDENDHQRNGGPHLRGSMSSVGGAISQESIAGSHGANSSIVSDTNTVFHNKPLTNRPMIPVSSTPSSAKNTAEMSIDKTTTTTTKSSAKWGHVEVNSPVDNSSEETTVSHNHGHMDLSTLNANANALMSSLLTTVNHNGGVLLPPISNMLHHHHETPATIPLLLQNPQLILEEAESLFGIGGSGNNNNNNVHDSQLIVANDDGTAGEELLSPGLFTEEAASQFRLSIVQTKQSNNTGTGNHPRQSSFSGRPNSGALTSRSRTSRPSSAALLPVSTIKEQGEETTNTANDVAIENMHDGVSGKHSNDGDDDDIDLAHGNDSPFLAKLEDTDIAKVFLFEYPEMYFEGVQALMMLISLYIALWLTNFMVAAKEPWEKALSIIFGCLCSILYIYIVRSAALLKAIYRLDNDAVLEVIEQTEGSRQLGIEMREKILSRLSDLGEPQAELYKIFSEIDESGNGTLR